MPAWTPTRIWTGQDVYILGGGPSLSGFNWEWLRGKHTIGCNTAFTLGEELCNVCFFSDLKWWDAFKQELASYKGLVVTHCPSLEQETTPWLKYMPREPKGLHHFALGFGGNSGCGAVNLAFLMGAKRVFLLGFDCKMEGEKSHWHDRRIEVPAPHIYEKFLNGWAAVAASLQAVFPEREIINLNPDSGIPFFPKVSAQEHFNNG